MKTIDPPCVPMGLVEDRTIEALPLSSKPEHRQLRISSMSWLSAATVHDLRNPLGTVFAGAEMLMELDLALPQARRLAANIYHAAGRMREILADATGGSGEKGLRIEICRIRDVITAASQAALLATTEQSVQILNDVSGSVDVPMERFRIERVFLNLISNALEAMPHGGEIRISMKRADQRVLIAVEDTGPGIPAEIRSRLFEPFVTAGKKDGMGLGLALSLRTVRDHGGELWVEPAAGARFVVCLPLRQIP